MSHLKLLIENIKLLKKRKFQIGLTINTKKIILISLQEMVSKNYHNRIIVYNPTKKYTFPWIDIFIKKRLWKSLKLFS